MTGIDLSGPRARVRERLLVDRCKLERNPQGWRNATFDETTGAYVVDGEGDDVDMTTLGTDIRSASRYLGEAVVQVAGTSLVVRRWSVKLDFEDAPEEPKIGDVVEFTTSLDPLLDGTRLYVGDVVTGTLRIWRELIVSRRFDGERRH